jgi:flagellar hook assembly protein FlgD
MVVWDGTDSRGATVTNGIYTIEVVDVRKPTKDELSALESATAAPAAE